MKRPILLISAAAAVFAAGYFTAHPRLGGEGRGGSETGKPGVFTAGDPSSRTDDGGNRGKTGLRTQAAATGKTPLFVPGQSRQWIEEMAKRTWDGDMVGAIALVQQCGALDPAAAQEMCETALEMMEQLKERDPAMDALFKSPEMLGITLISSIFRLSQSDPRRALELLGKPLSGEASELREMRQMIYANMAKVDLTQAMATLDTLQGDERVSALDGVIRSLGAKDPQAAVDLLLKNSGPEYRDQRRMLVEKLASTNPEFALRAATAFTVGGAEPGLLGELVQNGPPQLAEQALAWARDYQGEDRAEVSANLLQAVAAKDPKLAVQYLDRLGAGMSDDDVSQVAVSAVNSLTRKSPEDAAGWVRDLKAGPVQEAARLALVQNVIEKDLGEAGDLINTMQDGPRRDRAVGMLVSRLAGDSPEEALKWVDAMPEGGEKKTQRAKVFSEWMLKDPDRAAAAWNSGP